MAEPVGITGTAVGILSLCLQVYGGLKGYLDDYRDRDEYVNKTLLHLDRLRSLTNIIESTIPTLQNGHSTPSQTVALCLKDCETEMNSLNTEIQKFKEAVAIDLRGKLREAKKKLQFPFDRPALEKLAFSLDRANSLLTIALEGLHLHAQSTNQSKLIDITDSTRATAAGIATIDTKIDEIHTREATLEAIIGSNQTAITDISQEIRKLSLTTTEIHSSMSQINQIQVETSSSINILHDLSANYKLQQLRAGRLEDGMMEWKDAIINANENSPERKFLHMLMSKPDVLKNWQDDFAADKHALSAVLPGTTLESAISGTRHPVSARAGICGCQYRRYVNRKSFKWLVFTRFDESIVDFPHEPGCIRYQNTGARHEHTSSIWYAGLLQRLLNIAVFASFTRSYGAGGAGISATIRHFAMVDDRRSPAFKIICTLGHSIAYIWRPLRSMKTLGRNKKKAEMAMHQISRVALRKLQRIFANRSSLPTDISRSGCTIIEVLIQQCMEFHRAISKVLPIISPLMMRYILPSLLELGVPSLGRLQTERHVMASLLTRWNPRRADERDVLKNIALLIFQGESERCHLLCCDVFLRRTARECFAEVDGIRESFGLDSPLFTSLLMKDEPMLRRALRLLPTSSDSLVSNGISAVHIAVFWPRGLKILLHHCRDIDLDMKDNSNETPLNLAFKASSQLCHESGALCHNCHCAESVKILLEHACRIPPHISRLFRYASPNAINVFLDHIRSWRERLMEMARRELCEAELYDIGIHDSSILDHAARRVIQKLEAKGVRPYKELQLDSYDYRLSPISDEPETSSLYHDLDDMSGIQIAFNLGFKDIDVFYHNRTPVMTPFLGMEIYEWYLDHGVVITNLVPPVPSTTHQPRWTVAHKIMSELTLGCFRSKDEVDRLILKLGSLGMGDGCNCGCSDREDGCSPLKIFVTAAVRAFGPNIWTIFPAKLQIESLWPETIDNLASISSATANMVIRAYTFQALEIRHTCCAAYRWEPEDFSYIREEDESLLKELEELVAEFEDNFHSQEQPLSRFMEGYFKERMAQFKQEKDAICLSQNEKDNAACLGIKLKLYKQVPYKAQIPKTKLITLKDTTSEDNTWGGYVEDCIRQLNEIYPD